MLRSSARNNLARSCLGNGVECHVKVDSTSCHTDSAPSGAMWSWDPQGQLLSISTHPVEFDNVSHKSPRKRLLAMAQSNLSEAGQLTPKRMMRLLSKKGRDSSARRLEYLQCVGAFPIAFVTFPPTHPRTLKDFDFAVPRRRSQPYAVGPGRTPVVRCPLQRVFSVCPAIGGSHVIRCGVQ